MGDEAKTMEKQITLTDSQKIQHTYRGLASMGNRPNWTTIPITSDDMIAIKNDLIRVSEIISSEHPHFSKELFGLKVRLFIGFGYFDPQIFGQIMAILKALVCYINNPPKNGWNLIHPRISAVSKQLYLDGHFANAAQDAFVEINDRVKKIFRILNPSASKIPDGDAAMTTVFSPNNPMVKICDTTSDSGMNEQKGFMFMLQGAMSALRNPKAHANITITAEDSMRRLMYASMLMYKIDEAVQYSQIQE